MTTRLPLLLLFLAMNTLAAPVITVQTDRVTREHASATMPVSGLVVSREDAAIAAELDGRITWIAEVGDRVSAGEPLALLDQHLLELDVRSNMAEVRRIQANLEWLERQTNRLDELATRNNTAHSELDETRSSHAMLEQELAQAEVNLERARYDLSRAEIRAPFDGVVVSRNASRGEYTVTGSPLLRLVNTAAAEISVMAPLRLARYVKPGDVVAVSGDDTRREAVVRNLIEVGDARSHMMELRVEPRPGNWLIGEAVTVVLPASRQQALTTVSRDAIVLRDNSNFVYVVDTDNTAKRVNVELGSGIGERIAVTGQLKPGDAVIVRGAERLRPGQQVQVLEQAVGMR